MANITLKRWLAFGVALLLLVAPLQSAYAQPAQPKSPRKAALLSLLLPGAGELYAGGRRSSRFFFFTEGAFWAAMVAFRALESSREATFKSFAAAHAGARTEGKPESYFDEMVQYQSIYARNARALFLDGDLADLRPEVPGEIWEWDSEASRDKFQELRSKATSARQKALLFVGALLFNRFSSSLNAARIARKTGTPAPPQRLEMRVGARAEGGMQAQLQARF